MMDQNTFMKMMGTSSVLQSSLDLFNEIVHEGTISTSWIMEKWGILDDVTERRKKGINDILRDDRQA
jgi:hypothetical protein